MASGQGRDNRGGTGAAVMDDPADRESTNQGGGSGTGGSGTGGSGTGGSGGKNSQALAERGAGGGGRGRSGGGGGGRGGSGGGDSGGGSKGGGSKGSRSGERSVFDMYKPGQGYYTRMGTAVAGGLIILFGGNFLYQQLVFDAEWGIWVRAIIPLLFIAGLGFLLFRVVGTSRKTCDFFIATEGEMKKVSWSSKNEIIGSTKVVIIVSLAIGLMLFVVDILCMLFFTAIGVFKGVSVKELLFGAG